MNTHDIELPPLPPYLLSLDNLFPGESERILDYARAAIEADRKRAAELLQNPVHVHTNMCRGIIAPITFDMLAHVLGEEATSEWLRKRRGESVEYHPCTSILIEGLKRLQGGSAILAEWDRARSKVDAPQPADPVDKSKNLQGSPVDKSTKMQGQPAEPRLDAPAQVGHTRFGEGVPWSTVIGAAQRYYAAQNTPAKEQERLQRAAENIKALHHAEPVKVPSDADAKHVRDFINCDGMGAVIVEGPQYSAVVRTLLARYGQQATPQEPPSSD